MTGARWQPDPLLCGKTETPHFLRSPWDDFKALPFGPWRLNERVEPTRGQLAEAPAGEAEAALAAVPEAPAELLPETVEAPAGRGLSDDEIEAIRAAAFSDGERAGRAEATRQVAAERAAEGALLRHLTMELRALQQDPQRFYEPLKRLALHLAEQIVRGELQVSGKAVAELVQQSLAQLDHAAESVVVSLSPEDLKRLQALGSAGDGMVLEAAPELLPGSVRLRVNDTLVEDLIEHRVAAIARRLLASPEAWRAGQSPLLHPDAAPAVHDDGRQPAWQRPAIAAADGDQFMPDGGAGDAALPPQSAGLAGSLTGYGGADDGDVTEAP